jgi:hypothetical protein
MLLIIINTEGTRFFTKRKRDLFYKERRRKRDYFYIPRTQEQRDFFYKEKKRKRDLFYKERKRLYLYNENTEIL